MKSFYVKSGGVVVLSPIMTPGRKRGIMRAATVVAAGFVVLNVFAYNHAHAMLHFGSAGSRTNKPEALTLGQKMKVLLVGVNAPRPHSDRSPADLSEQCRRLTIPSSDGVTLGAWYVDCGAQTPLVILFHGYAAEKSCLLQEARTFLELGMSVLLVDFRGSGDSSESHTTIGVREADDVATVMHYARNTMPHSRRVLYGQSMGAVAILRAVCRNGAKPDAVIVEAVFDTMLNTVRHRFNAMGIPYFPCAELLVFWGGFQTGFNGFSHNPVVYAQSLACPALFMHGDDDPRARVEEGRRVFAKVPGPKRFKVFPSVGHEAYASRFPAEWKATVEEFMRLSGDQKTL